MAWKETFFGASDDEVVVVRTDDDDSSSCPLDNLDVFESCLGSMGSIGSAQENFVDPKPSFDISDTLLDGIGSAGDLVHHRGGASSSDFTDLDDEEYFTSSSSPPNTPQKVQPWNGHISWEDTSVLWGDDSLKTNQHLYKTWSNGNFVDLGLVYRPQRNDENAYRTVYLTHLPLDVGMKDLLSAIRGGPVYVAHIMNMEKSAGYHMGIVTFVWGKDAAAYVEFAAAHGVYFNGSRVNVSLSKTPTYPITKEIRDNILDQLYTRCLLIRGEPEPRRYTYIAWNLKKKTPTDFEMGDQMIENEEETEIEIRFSSIGAADRAYQVLRSLLRDCTVRFALDPCARPLPGVKRGMSKQNVPLVEPSKDDP